MSGSNTARLAWRLVALAFAAVLLQVTVISEIRIFGAAADLVPLVCAAVGLLLGSLTGAGFGFGLGLVVDIILYQPLGISSLVYLGAGFAAGRLRELRDPQAPAIPIWVGAATTIGVMAAFVVIRFLLGNGMPLSFELVRQFLSTAVLNALIAIPVFSLVRRLLAAVLPDDGRRRRRRSYTTGGLSPLSRS